MCFDRIAGGVQRYALHTCSIRVVLMSRAQELILRSLGLVQSLSKLLGLDVVACMFSRQQSHRRVRLGVLPRSRDCSAVSTFKGCRIMGRLIAALRAVRFLIKEDSLLRCLYFHGFCIAGRVIAAPRPFRILAKKD